MTWRLLGQPTVWWCVVGEGDYRRGDRTKGRQAGVFRHLERYLQGMEQYFTQSLIHRLTGFPVDFLDKSRESPLNKLRQESARSPVRSHTLACLLCSRRPYLHMVSHREFCFTGDKWLQEPRLTGFKNRNIRVETTVNNRYKRNVENKES